MDVLNIKDKIAYNPEKLNKVSLFDTDKFFCDVYCLQPGQKQKVHAHEGSDKVYYMLEGKANITVGSEEREVCSGEITIAPSGVDHGVINHTSVNSVILVFMAPKPS